MNVNTYVGPVVEYGTQIWCPFSIKSDTVKVLRSYTKRLPEVTHLSYDDRGKALQIISLEHSRLVADLNLVYKIIKGQIYLHFEDFVEYAGEAALRSHCLKLRDSKTATESVRMFFAFSFVSLWNQLPEDTVTSTSLRLFNSRD